MSHDMKRTAIILVVGLCIGMALALIFLQLVYAAESNPDVAELRKLESQMTAVQENIKKLQDDFNSSKVVEEFKARKEVVEYNAKQRNYALQLQELSKARQSLTEKIVKGLLESQRTKPTAPPKEEKKK